MHPAPSVILFSVLSGLGFGFLAFLGWGALMPSGWAAFLLWGLGYGLAVAGLLAATFHLGNPKNALKAFTHWRTSWLSREAWASVATLVLLAPVALSDIFGLGLPRILGQVGGALAILTVFTTAMIYTQIKAVPRWHHWLTPIMFLTFALAGGAMLSGRAWAPVPLLAVGAVLLAVWRVGDGAFARAGQSLGTATGLDRLGVPSVLDPAHTAGNYLKREMIFVVGRKHAARLRKIALVLASLAPALVLLLPLGLFGIALAAVLHLAGALAARWLFFAEAEHVVGLYYGARG
ncbi:DmsC/YnfH family molybdoenzyme membrane anchor subunit [Tabrizicola sp. YIM 78059]|uniref:dimethyl sulfoxide reductase anchor subunit family protein n=1 Tax=Tabrizicola sp. YIM 78059 TaxID=2529861 RepID=UPI0010A9BF28|nr:DmsC/YnfH family molybdoenzyme membrane anchor subunit [Tabrizicola sp. YIM 78059]